ALTDITVESGWQRFEPRLCAAFSDGFRTSCSVRPSACFAYCERHAVWDVEALCDVLLREAQRFYAQMLQEPRRPFDHGRFSWLRASMRFVRNGWSRRGRRQGEVLALETAAPGRFLEDGREAWRRGLKLLEEQLSPEQRRQYDRSGYFD